MAGRLLLGAQLAVAVNLDLHMAVGGLCHIGRLTKDPVPAVRDTALKNKRTSWKMRLEGAQDPTADAETLDFLGVLGTESEEGAPAVLSSMVRRAVALNPNTSEAMLAKLANDPSAEVRHAVESRR